MATQDLKNDPRLRCRLIYRLPELDHHLRGRDRDGVIRFCVEKILWYQTSHQWESAERLLRELNEGLQAEVKNSRISPEKRPL